MQHGPVINRRRWGRKAQLGQQRLFMSMVARSGAGPAAVIYSPATPSNSSSRIVFAFPKKNITLSLSLSSFLIPYYYDAVSWEARNSKREETTTRNGENVSWPALFTSRIITSKTWDCAHEGELSFNWRDSNPIRPRIDDGQLCRLQQDLYGRPVFLSCLTSV